MARSRNPPAAVSKKGLFAPDQQSAEAEETIDQGKRRYFVLAAVPQTSVAAIQSAQKRALTELVLQPHSIAGRHLNEAFAEAKQHEATKIFKTKLEVDFKDTYTAARGLLTRLGRKAEKRDVCQQIFYLEPTKHSKSDISQIDIRENDVLYIVGHFGNGVIGMQQYVNLNAHDLASDIEKTGVSKNLATLKIMACNTGLYEKHDDGRTRFFISDLCKALYELGYTHLTVYGYIGYVQETLRGKHSMTARKKGEPGKPAEAQFRASECRVAVTGPLGKTIKLPEHALDVEIDPRWRDWKQTPHVL